ncbi:MAG: hypothetical protein AAFZ63_01450 [Bacteroidota bacterium]
MAKKKLVNAETDRNVDEFIADVSPKYRQADSKVLIKMMEEITGFPPKIWGVSIVGFGKYPYQRKMVMNTNGLTSAFHLVKVG